MLAEWLAPHDLDWFRETHLRKTPYARPGAAADAIALLDGATIDRVLGSDGPLDLLTVRNGVLVPAAAPRSLLELRRLGRSGVSVVVRGAERHDPGLATLARAFEHALPGEVHVQLYATPGGSRSYGWHYDFEDVFIVQTAGVKDYYFRANTVAGDTRLGDTLDFARVTDETSPKYTARLLAGDWLYLPARWWHLVTCAEDALSISVGVMSPVELARARRLPSGWSGRRTGR
jgi:ribosomal protein L16 Arg81 hydroxylase